MGPSPQWLHLLVLVALMIDNVMLATWSRRHSESPERQPLVLLSSGAVLALLGQGLELVTRSTGRWINELAWGAGFAGLLVVLFGILWVGNVMWKERRQLRKPLTDPLEYSTAQKLQFALLASPVSVVIPHLMLDSKRGFVASVLLLLAAAIAPIAFGLIPKATNEVS